MKTPKNFPVEVPAPDTTAQLQAGTILLIHDNDMVPGVTPHVLQRYSRRVLKAGGGKEALRICDRIRDTYEKHNRPR